MIAIASPASGQPSRHAALLGPRVLLCALPPDLAWSRAWTSALPRDERRRVRVEVLSGRALTLPSPCPRGFLAGPAAAALAPPGRHRLAVPFPVAGYLAGAMVGAALPREGPVPTVQVAAPLLPTIANEALLAGLAQGLAATAPSGTALRVGGRKPPQVTVLLDAAEPGALVRWRSGAARGRCGADGHALATRLEAAARHRSTSAGEDATFFRCTLTPAVAKADAARGAAEARLATGFRPASLPDFVRPPLAVPPWQRVMEQPRRRRR
jgi:hypothetical protein